jgi:hypothetical protein
MADGWRGVRYAGCGEVSRSLRLPLAMISPSAPTHSTQDLIIQFDSGNTDNDQPSRANITNWPARRRLLRLLPQCAMASMLVYWLATRRG